MYSVIEWIWFKMSFLKRKRVKFAVDLQVIMIYEIIKFPRVYFLVI